MQTNPVRICKAPEQPLLTVSKATAEGGPPLLLSAERCNLDLWRLGSEAISLVHYVHPSVLSAHASPVWLLLACYKLSIVLMSPVLPLIATGGAILSFNYPGIILVQESEEPGTDVAEGQRMELAAMPKHEARISAAGRGHISAIAISPQGDRLALVDAEGLSVYSIQHSAGGIKLGRNRLKGLAALKPLEVAFAGEHAEQLLVADSDGVLMVLDLDKEAQVGALLS